MILGKPFQYAIYISLVQFLFCLRNLAAVPDAIISWHLDSESLLTCRELIDVNNYEKKAVFSCLRKHFWMKFEEVMKLVLGVE